MSDRSETMVRECNWRVGEYCFRRVIELARDAIVNLPPQAVSRRAERLAIRKALVGAMRTGDGLRRCKLVAWGPCHFLPVYKKKRRELWLCGKLLLCLKNRSKQAQVLEAFQLRHWPPCIEDPLGSFSATDPENGLSDIIYELNNKQKNLPQRVRFWCNGRSIHWEIVGDGPSNQ